MDPEQEPDPEDIPSAQPVVSTTQRARELGLPEPIILDSWPAWGDAGRVEIPPPPPVLRTETANRWVLLLTNYLDAHQAAARQEAGVLANQKWDRLLAGE